MESVWHKICKMLLLGLTNGDGPSPVPQEIPWYRCGHVNQIVSYFTRLFAVRPQPNQIG